MRRIGTIVSALLVAGALAAGAGASPAPQAGRTVPVNGRILFTHCDETRGCEIYTANPDGSAVRRVTRTRGANFLGDWSPDGTRIVYVSTSGGDQAIWIADADGANATQLTPDDPNSDPLWPRFTPDGRRILFVDCEGFDCDGGIGSVRPDGTHLHMVTPNSGDSYNLADLSPDGSRLAYMRWHVGGVKMAIYVSDADGSNERRVSPPRLEGWLPDWSPAGDRILFTSDINFERPAPSLFAVRPAGGGLVSVTQPPFPHADWYGSYSPDGTKILFDSDRRYADFCCADVFIADADGSHVHRVPLPMDVYDPRWGTAPAIVAATPSLSVAPVVGGPPCRYVASLSRSPACRRD